MRFEDEPVPGYPLPILPGHTSPGRFERVLRAELAPDKINLATLGNQVPHLHWHVIPRFADDAHFPDPVWAARRRAGVAHGVDERRMIERLRAALGDSSIA